MLTRRDFIKLNGAGLLALLFSELYLDPVRAAATSQGRVAYSKIWLRSIPSMEGNKVGSYLIDTILDIAEEVVGGTAADYNRVWYRIGGEGYVYSGVVQPVQTVLNRTVPDLPESGILGELTVPYTESWWGINRVPFAGPRLYYASTHWIQEVVSDRRDGSLWYKAYDHLYNAYYYVRPQHIRILPPDELAPLSPDVPGDEKRMEIHLNEQVVLAFEGDKVVFTARTATGKGEFNTPTGRFQSFHKRPTAHMVGGDGVTSIYDLAGVPWDTYITEDGIALHGTYWHNDFGQPRSHGCINLTPQAAYWIYRWTLPVVPPGERLIYAPGSGTSVQVL